MTSAGGIMAPKKTSITAATIAADVGAMRFATHGSPNPITSQNAAAPNAQNATRRSTAGRSLVTTREIIAPMAAIAAAMTVKRSTKSLTAPRRDNPEVGRVTARGGTSGSTTANSGRISTSEARPAAPRALASTVTGSSLPSRALR